MPYRWIEGVTLADLAFEATGPTLAEVFGSAWQALVDAMVDAEGLGASAVRRAVSLEAGSWEELLLALLERVVYLKDAEGLVLLPSSVDLSAGRRGVHLAASAPALAVEEALGRLRTDVKAVTMHGYTLAPVPGGWRATAVLDV